MDQATQLGGCAQCGASFIIRPRGRRRIYCSQPCRQRASHNGRRAQNGNGPPCKCGCGQPVTWDSSRRKWYAYRAGHYRRHATYKDEAWLRQNYAAGQTVWEIAAGCGVNHSTILKFMRKYGIERRDRSESRMNRHMGHANAAWKGGVAQWPYSKNWTELARQIRDRDKWTCQDCGECRKRWGVALHVHHIDENKLNDDPANLISLCAKCHMIRHGAAKEEVVPDEDLVA